MPIVVQTTTSSTPASTATTTVQSILDAVSQDIRSLLGSTGTDANILIDYCNRIHLDILRRSKWVFLLSTTQTFTTINGTASYYLGTGIAPSGSTSVSLNLTDLYNITENSVIDRTNTRRLTCVNDKPVGVTFDTAGTTAYPTLYRNDLQDGPYVLTLYGTPNGAYTIEFRYQKNRNILTSASQVLQVPDIYKDIVIAGVNSLASQFLKMPEDVQAWEGRYQGSLRGMLQDKNLYNRPADFIRPDPSSIY